jgi:hypothetical protein
MTRQLLNALIRVHKFYLFANSDEFLISATQKINRHKIFLEDYPDYKRADIEELQLRAADIPDACKKALAVLVSNTEFPKGFQRDKLEVACKKLSVVADDNFRAYKDLLVDAIERLKFWNANLQDAEEAAQANADQSKKANAKQYKKGDYSLRRISTNLWKMTYNGESGEIVDCVGMFYLAELLKETRPTLNALDLYRAAKNLPPNTNPIHSVEPKDPATKQMLQDKQQKLSAEFAEERKYGDSYHSEELEREIKSVVNKIHRPDIDSDYERARTAVKKSINEAIKKVCVAGTLSKTDIRDYLKINIHTGLESYFDRPANTPQWEVVTDLPV